MSYNDEGDEVGVVPSVSVASRMTVLSKSGASADAAKETVGRGVMKRPITRRHGKKEDAAQGGRKGVGMTTWLRM